MSRVPDGSRLRDKLLYIDVLSDLSVPKYSFYRCIIDLSKRCNHSIFIVYIHSYFCLSHPSFSRSFQWGTTCLEDHISRRSLSDYASRRCWGFGMLWLILNCHLGETPNQSLLSVYMRRQSKSKERGQRRLTERWPKEPVTCRPVVDSFVRNARPSEISMDPAFELGICSTGRKLRGTKRLANIHVKHVRCILSSRFSPATPRYVCQIVSGLRRGEGQARTFF